MNNKELVETIEQNPVKAANELPHGNIQKEAEQITDGNGKNNKVNKSKVNSDPNLDAAKKWAEGVKSVPGLQDEIKPYIYSTGSRGRGISDIRGKDLHRAGGYSGIDNNDLDVDTTRYLEDVRNNPEAHKEFLDNLGADSNNLTEFESQFRNKVDNPLGGFYRDNRNKVLQGLLGRKKPKFTWDGIEDKPYYNDWVNASPDSPEFYKAYQGVVQDYGQESADEQLSRWAVKLGEALDSGDKDTVEEIIEEHPEEAVSVLPEDSPLQKEAEQVMDGDERTTEVNDDVVEEALQDYTTEEKPNEDNTEVAQDKPFQEDLPWVDVGNDEVMSRDNYKKEMQQYKEEHPTEIEEVKKESHEAKLEEDKEKRAQERAFVDAAREIADGEIEDDETIATDVIDRGIEDENGYTDPVDIAEDIVTEEASTNEAPTEDEINEESNEVSDSKGFHLPFIAGTNGHPNDHISGSVGSGSEIMPTNGNGISSHASRTPMAGMPSSSINATSLPSVSDNKGEVVNVDGAHGGRIDLPNKPGDSFKGSGHKGMMSPNVVNGGGISSGATHGGISATSQNLPSGGGHTQTYQDQKGMEELAQGMRDKRVEELEARAKGLEESVAEHNNITIKYKTIYWNNTDLNELDNGGLEEFDKLLSSLGV